MAQGEIYLRVIDITTSTTYAPTLLDAFGRTFTEGIIEIARKERTANGRLVIDIINTKKKFTLSYDVIDGVSLDEYIDIYNANSELELTVWYNNTEYTDYRVIMSPFDRERWILTGNGLWRGVSFEFEEI